MAVSLTVEQLAFFDRMARSPEGVLLLQAVKSWQADVDKTLRHSHGDDVLRAQGDARRLEELEGLLSGAAAKRLNDLSKPVRSIRRVASFDAA